MKTDLDLVITHNGTDWIARNGEIEVSGVSLGELDSNLTAALRRDGRFSGSRITVFMGFDNATFPTWLRQYASHYFNRYVRLEI